MENNVGIEKVAPPEPDPIAQRLAIAEDNARNASMSAETAQAAAARVGAALAQLQQRVEQIASAAGGEAVKIGEEGVVAINRAAQHLENSLNPSFPEAAEIKHALRAIIDALKSLVPLPEVTNPDERQPNV